VLVVEDDPNIAELVKHTLDKNGYETTVAEDGEQGLALARRVRPDFVILDLMLPGMDGIEVCQSIRRDAGLASTPVIMLTARTDDADVVLGLTVGADDYIPKPFSPSVLLARLRALTRRLRMGGEPGDVVKRGELRIDKGAHRAFVSGKEVYMTRTEFRLLTALADRPGRALDRPELLDLAIGEDVFVIDRTIDVHIASLRKKLGGCSNLIETVRGIGYRFQDTW